MLRSTTALLIVLVLAAPAAFAQSAVQNPRLGLGVALTNSPTGLTPAFEVPIDIASHVRVQPEFRYQRDSVNENDTASVGSRFDLAGDRSNHEFDVAWHLGVVHVSPRAHRLVRGREVRSRQIVNRFQRLWKLRAVDQPIDECEWLLRRTGVWRRILSARSLQSWCHDRLRVRLSRCRGAHRHGVADQHDGQPARIRHTGCHRGANLPALEGWCYRAAVSTLIG